MTNTIELALELTPTRMTRILFAGFVFSIAALKGAPVDSQRTFPTPLALIQATIEAAEHNDTAALLRLFGPEGKDILESGNAAEDKELRAEFARSAHEKLQIEEDPYNVNRVEFTVGMQEWPFPVPIVRKGGKWQLDSAAGRMEILARRVGRNELNAMEVCRGYAEAQLDYATGARDGDSVLKYAEHIASSRGKQDGLYNEAETSRLVSQAFVEATLSDPQVTGKTPYQGYYFRVLRAQGPDAPGGLFDYLVKGRMIGGFAMVAWPAEYGVSGIQTFLISHHGLVYGKDMGSGTPLQVRQMTRFNPDRTWHPIVLE